MTLSKIAPLAIGRSAFGIAYLKNNIYALGGYNHLLDNLAFCECYSLYSNTWSSFPDLPHPLISPTACSFDDRYIYLVGGSPEINRNYSAYLQSILRFDLDDTLLQKWESIDL